MIELVPYTAERAEDWNALVAESRNGTFLIDRNYMDYHAHRFADSSYMFYFKEKLYALLPACRIEDKLYSHAGLTYGGLIMNEKCTVEKVMAMFESLIPKLKEDGIKEMIYKPVPYIYHSLPSEEDIYALFRLKASLIGRNVSSTICADNRLPFKKDRMAALNKALKADIDVKESSNFKVFWNILENNLKEKYESQPVHSLSEILSLSFKFPDNIKLYCAYQKEKILGGILCYITKSVVHYQYISATPEGKKTGAVDAIVSWLLDAYPEKKYFDMGTSNGNNGRCLNESLIYQKEGFGGRAVCYDIYRITL